MTKYQIIAKWQGDKNNTYLPLESKPVTINTVNQHYVVTIESENTVIKLNDNINFTIRVTNQALTLINNATVKINEVTPNGTHNTYTCTPTGTTGTTTWTHTLTTKGVYTYTAVVEADTTYRQGVSTTYTVYTDVVGSTLATTVDRTTVQVGESITLQNILSSIGDSVTPYISGEYIHLYMTYNDGTTDINTIELPSSTLGENYTNTAGLNQRTILLDKVGIYKFYCIFEGDSRYESSTGNTVTITTTQIDTKLVCLTNDTLYPSWKFRMQLSDLLGNPITEETIHLTFIKDSKTTTVDVVTNNSGIAETTAIDTTTACTINYTATYIGTSKYTAKTVTGTVNVKSSQIMEYTPALITSLSNAVPYKTWHNTGNTQLRDDNLYMRCGKTGSPIATKTGTYNTPSPISMKTFDIKLPTDSKIISIKYRWWMRNVANDGTNYPFTATDQCKVEVAGLTDNLTGVINDKTTNNTFKMFQATWANPTILVSTLNNTTLTAKITFPQNNTMNTGFLDIDYISVLIEYIPNQGG